jgi:hypothetical protein
MNGLLTLFQNSTDSTLSYCLAVRAQNFADSTAQLALDERIRLG